MKLHLHNTLTGKLEEFVPLEPGKVRLYTCGPTVYDFAHIGNFRTFVFQDILRRTLRLYGYELKHVMNVTDVDDKIILKAQAEGVSIGEVARPFEQALLEDSAVLGIEKPEKLVRATEHIAEMVALVEQLLERGTAYASEGSVYFSIQKFPAYGQLAGLDIAGLKPGARIEADAYEKGDPRDFVLWKASKPGEPVWEASFGPGRPGWHIECSAMSMKYLGETFDIHTGGTDLVFPHHTNEIAQSEAATGKPFVRYWLHAEHLIVEGEKMSKSLGNQYTLRDLLEQGYRPSAIRYLLASVPYRKQLNFTFDALRQAQHSIDRIRNFLLRLRAEEHPEGTSELPDRAATAREEFQRALGDDLNTAEALAAVFELVREANTAIDEGRLRAGDMEPVEEVIQLFDSVFGVLADDRERLRLLDGKLKQAGAVEGTLTDSEVEELLAARRQARADRDFEQADRIRDRLTAGGIIVEDSRDGVRWRRK